MKLSKSTIGSRWHQPCPHCEGSFSTGQRFVACGDCETAHHIRCANEAQACKNSECTPPSKGQAYRVASSRLRAIRAEIRKDETKRHKRRELFPGACDRVKTRAQRLREWSASAGARKMLLWLMGAGGLLITLGEILHGDVISADHHLGMYLILGGFLLLCVYRAWLDRDNPNGQEII